jgi:hypothetical protein
MNNVNQLPPPDLKLIQAAFHVLLRPETKIGGNEVITVYRAAELLDAIIQGGYVLTPANGSPQGDE